MLKVTTQQLIDSQGQERNRVGEPMAFSAAMEQAIGSNDLYTVPDGHVLFITDVIIQGDFQTSLTGANPNISPAAADLFTAMTFAAADGTGEYSLTFKSFFQDSTLLGITSPDFRTSQPSNVTSWRPKYPIPVPSNWTVQQAANTYPWGNFGGFYGIVVTEDSAMQLGYNALSSDTPAERRYGIESSNGVATGTTLITGRSGKSIRILDVHIRMQPASNVTNRIIFEQGDGTCFFTIQNDNPTEMLEESFSPEWYLKAGENFVIDGDVANAGSVNITYEFVDEDEVPGDLWWACVNPISPTPGVGTIGNATAPFTASNDNEVTCYYPRWGTTKTSPTKGFQHLLRGYVVNIQKLAGSGTNFAEEDIEQTRLSISSGATGGSIVSALAGQTQTNYQMSPLFSASGNDQCVHHVSEGINVPGKKDDGSIWVDVFGYRALSTTPTSGDADISGCYVSLWGRTIPSRITDRTNQGA